MIYSRPQNNSTLQTFFSLNAFGLFLHFVLSRHEPLCEVATTDTEHDIQVLFSMFSSDITSFTANINCACTARAYGIKMKLNVGLKLTQSYKIN